MQAAVKNLLKRGGYHQLDLAKALGVSLPTMKRLLNGQELGLDRLEEIAAFFSLSVFELMELSREKKAEIFPFTEIHESFLAKSLLNLLVFRGFLRGHPASVIKAQYGLSAAQLEKILIGLDRAGLVEFWNQERVKLKAKWPFKWIEEGELQRTYMPGFLKMIFSHSSARSGLLKQPRGENNFFRPFELAVRAETYDEFRKELALLLEKYRSISKFELASQSAESLLDITGLLACDSFSAWDELWKEKKGVF